MTLGEIGCQLGADGADVEIGPRCPTVEQQQPCTASPALLGAREQLTVVRNDLRKFPCDEFLPPHRMVIPWSSGLSSRLPLQTLAVGSTLAASSKTWHLFGTKPPRFQMRVLPWCTLILASRHNSSRNTSCTATVRSGVDTTHKSSRNAKSRSPSSNLSEMATNAACCPQLNNMGMSGSPCSPPSPCRM